MYFLGKFINSLCYPCVDVSIVCFLCEIIFFYKFVRYHWELDHDVFVPVHMIVQLEILYVHAHILWFDVWDGAVYMDFHCGQVWCWYADLSWVIYQIPSFSQSCSMGLCFLWSDIAYLSYICCPYVFWFVFMEEKFACISPRMWFPILGHTAKFVARGIFPYWWIPFH